MNLNNKKYSQILPNLANHILKIIHCCNKIPLPLKLILEIMNKIIYLIYFMGKIPYKTPTQHLYHNYKISIVCKLQTHQ